MFVCTPSSFVILIVFILYYKWNSESMREVNKSWWAQYVLNASLTNDCWREHTISNIIVLYFILCSTSKIYRICMYTWRQVYFCFTQHCIQHHPVTPVILHFHTDVVFIYLIQTSGVNLQRNNSVMGNFINYTCFSVNDDLNMILEKHQS